MLNPSMPTPLTESISATSCASQRLLGTALAGLLCFATAGCSTTQDTQGSGAAGAAGLADAAGAAGQAAGGTAGAAGATTGDAGRGTDAAAGAATAGSADAAGAAGTGGTVETAGTAGVVDSAGAGGAPAEFPHITSSKNVGVLTVEEFTALCDKRGGTVEVMPHCGGFATAKGFSYDATTQLLSEHTCMGANTCAGWNCAIVD